MAGDPSGCRIEASLQQRRLERHPAGGEPARRAGPMRVMRRCSCSLVASAIAVSTGWNADAAVTSRRCGEPSVLCARVEAGSVQEFSVEVVNGQDGIEHSLRLSPAETPRYLRDVRIEPPSVQSLYPGQRQEFRVRFDVGKTGKAEAVDELVLLLTSNETSTPREEVALLVTIVEPYEDTPNFSGAWSCPLRGVITFQIDGTRVAGSVTGRPGEHWGAGQRAGGRIEGTIEGNQLSLTMDSGDGTFSQLTATLAPDGRSFSGSWEWFRGTARLGSGTWTCSRQAA